MAQLSQQERAQQHGRGRDASTPGELTPRGWKDIFWRVFQEIGDDRVMFNAAGVTYSVIFALVPTLAALVSLYGLFFDPASAIQHVQSLGAVLPGEAQAIIDEQVQRLAEQGETTLGWTLAISLGIAIWSAMNAMSSLFIAMNIAYDEDEDRGFFSLQLVALLFALGGIVTGAALFVLTAVLPAIFRILGLETQSGVLLQALGYLGLIIVLGIGLAALYRYGPSRKKARWQWVTPGAVLAVFTILLASILFSWYLNNWGNYDATYGSLGAAMGLLTWIWLSVCIVLIGAEINAEMEHQTARDSTIAPKEPLGRRGASMADHIGRSSAEGAGEKPESARPTAPLDENPGSPTKPGNSRSLAILLFALPIALIVVSQRRRHRARRSVPVDAK